MSRISQLRCLSSNAAALPEQVSYFYDSELGDFYYGPTHPMKPHRVRMAHDLIVRYGLYSQLQVCASVLLFSLAALTRSPAAVILACLLNLPAYIHHVQGESQESATAPQSVSSVPSG
jgi:acetoin utilization deacetylase AcuC-like enzyme